MGLWHLARLNQFAISKIEIDEKYTGAQMLLTITDKSKQRSNVYDSFSKECLGLDHLCSSFPFLFSFFMRT